MSIQPLRDNAPSATGSTEVAALRKRVEGWEEEARKYASDVTYWRTRAEKAERERDAALESLASYQASAHNYVLKHQENAKLQADLDAALRVALGVSTELKLLALGHPFLKETAENWAKNLDALLEKKRERG